MATTENGRNSESDQNNSFELQPLIMHADEETDPTGLIDGSEPTDQTGREELQNDNRVTPEDASGPNIEGNYVTDGRRKENDRKALRCYKSKKGFRLHVHVEKNNAFKVKRLLLQEKNVDVVDEQNYTPLLLAGKNIRHFQKGKVKDYEEIVKMLLERNANPNAKPPDNEMTPLETAASLRSHLITKLLLEKGADPFKLPITESKNTAVHLAAEAAAPKTLEIIFDHLKELSEKCETENEKENFLKERQELANMKNNEGFTPLHLAAKARSRHCVYALIDAGADMGSTGGIGVSALDFLLLHFQNSVQFMEKYFDSKILPHTGYSKNEQFSIMLDFCMLAPHIDGNQMTVVRALVEGKDPTEKMRGTLLCHPLVESFITMKWLSLRPLFYWQLFLYAIFVVSLSGYVILVHLDIDHSDSGIFNTALALKVILIILSMFVALFVVVHFLMMPKYYLLECNMWMNLATGIASTIIAVKGDDCKVVADNHSNSEEHNHCWVSYLASVTILVSWMKVITLIRRFPEWSAHVHLFFAVCKNLCNIIFVFIWMILGFSLSFFILFHKTDEDIYGNPWRALVKTVVMMLGEFEYESLFKGQNTEKKFGLFIFLFFLILASIVLLNLTVGYAVRDTQETLTEGKKRCLRNQVKFLHYTQEEIKDSNCVSQHLRKYFLRDVHIPILISVLGDQKKHDGLMSRLIYGLFVPFLFLYRLFRRHLNFKRCNPCPSPSSSVKKNCKRRYKPWTSGLSLALIESLLNIALRNGWDKNIEITNEKPVGNDNGEETKENKVADENDKQRTTYINMENQ